MSGSRSCRRTAGTPRTAYIRVRLDVVVEVAADLALDGLRLPRPVWFMRVRSDIQPADLQIACRTGTKYSNTSYCQPLD